MLKKHFASNHLYKAGLAMASFLFVMGIALHMGNSELSKAYIDDGHDNFYDDHGADDYTDDYGHDNFYDDCEAVGDCAEGPDHDGNSLYDDHGTDDYTDDYGHDDGDSTGEWRGAWETKASMPTARYWTHAVAANRQLYVVGGNGQPGEGITGALEAYNPSTDKWSTKATMTDPAYGGALGVIGSKLYLAGGWNWPASGIPQKTLKIYDIATNTWSQGADMPLSSGCSIAGIIDGKMYVLTGCNGFYGYRKFLHVYDPDSDTWTEKAQAPNSHADGAGAVINGKFYVAGGMMDDMGTPSGQLDVYDPKTDSWKTLASMGEVHNGTTAGAIKGKLYVVGGYFAQNREISSVEVYDPATDSWSYAPFMPTARKLLASGVIDDKLYAVGGDKGGVPLATLEVFDPEAIAYDDGDNEDHCSDNPVCGSDSVTYRNDCEAEDAGVRIDYDGECKPQEYTCPDEKELVCGTDGVTYLNPCLADQEDAIIDHDGECEPEKFPSDMEDMESALNEVDEGMHQLGIMLEWFENMGVDLSALEAPFSEIAELFSLAEEQMIKGNSEAFWKTMDKMEQVMNNEFLTEFERILMNSDLDQFFEEIGAEIEAIDEEASLMEANGEVVPNVYYDIQNLGKEIGMAFENGNFESAMEMIDKLVILINDFWNELGQDHTIGFEPPAGFEGEVITATSRNAFPDTDASSLEGIAASYLYNRAIIGGFPDGEFKGDRTVNRAEAAKFLLLAADIDVQELLNKGRFWDVLEGQWYVKYVITAAEEGVISGYSDGSFKPANNVNTAEFLKMISLAFGADLNLPHSYRDVPANAWFAQYAGIAKQHNLFPNRSRELKPGQELTRREVAIAIYQYLIRR